MATLLSICQEAAGRLGLENLGSIVQNNNASARRLYRLANESMEKLGRRGDWEILLKEITFTAVNAEIQTDDDAVPDDLDHIVNDTAYNRTSRRRLVGPLTAQEWAEQRNVTSSVVVDSFRFRGGNFITIPSPTAGDIFVYEYVSNYWIALDSAPTTGVKSKFTLDDDVPLLNDEMITLDIMWRYRNSVGLSYSEFYRNAELFILDRLAKDSKVKRIMDLGRQRYSSRARMPTIPEGNWNL